MSILVDRQIDWCVSQDPPLASDVPHNDFMRAESQIQAASLDLTIGAIHIPGTDSDNPGARIRPRLTTLLRRGKRHWLGQKRYCECLPIWPASVSRSELVS